MTILVLEDTYPEVAEQAAKELGIEVEVFTDPAEALDRLDEFEVGVFDIFQPRVGTPSLNRLLEEYLRETDDALEEYSELRHKHSRGVVYIDKDAKLWPYGAALAWKFTQEGASVIFNSNIHRHSIPTREDRGVSKEKEERANGAWDLLFPFRVNGVLDEDEFGFFGGYGPRFFGGLGREKIDPEVWKDALKAAVMLSSN